MERISKKIVEFFICLWNHISLVFTKQISKGYYDPAKDSWKEKWMNKEDNEIH